MREQKVADIDSILRTIHNPTFYPKHIPVFNANGKEEVQCLCPLHEDKEPSLSVNIETGLWHCFGGCGGGNAIQFIQKLYSLSFDEAVAKIKTEEGIGDIETPARTPKKQNPSVSPPKPAYLSFDQIKTIHNQLMKMPEILQKFTQKYGLTDETIKKYFIGYQNEHFVIPIEIEPAKWIIKEHKGYQSKGAKVSLYPSDLIKEGIPFIMITEGEFKSLLLNQFGFPSVSGTGGAGTWKAEWNSLFAGLNVVLAFDADEAGIKGAQRVVDSLKGKAKSIKVIQWPQELDGSKDKKDVTDFFITLGKTKEDFYRVIEDAREIPQKDRENSSLQYFVNDEGYSCRQKTTTAGPIPVRLANFSARIEQEIIEDDGIDQKRLYQISGKIENERTLPKIEINASSFNSMKWTYHWGTQARLEPGEAVKDHLRYFIQLSSHPKETVCYSHTGWREIDGEWVFLSASGAIGKPHVSTKLPRELQRYILPLEPKKEDEAIATSLDFLSLSRPEITYPILGMTYLSPLTTIIEPQPNFSGFLYGESGSKKTTLAVLQLAHFGNFTSIYQLTNFEATANMIMRRAFTLKDVLNVIDDYHPSAQEKDAQRKEAILQRIVRSASNRTDRGRLNADSTEKGSYEPRGMIVVTGEDLPALQSTLARMLVVEILQYDVDLMKLTELQKKAHLLPHAMVSYLLFLKNNFLKIQSLFSEMFPKLREKAVSANMHGKFSEQITFLYFTFEVVTSWAVEKGIINNQQSTEIKTQAWQVFTGLASSQQRRVEREDPVRTFLDVLNTLIHQGKVYMEHKENHLKVPILGQLKGDFIGCFDEDHFYIMPPALWNVIQRFCRMEGTHFPVTKNTLYRLLKIKKIIETKGDKHTITNWIKGKPTKVLKFYRAVIDNLRGN